MSSAYLIRKIAQELIITTSINASQKLITILSLKKL